MSRRGAGRQGGRSAGPHRWLTVALLLALVTGGCGFRLRGSLDVPPALSPVYIQSGGLVGDAVAARLQGTAVQVTDRPGDTRLLIRILSEQRGSRVIAVDRQGRSLAFLLSYQVAFDAVDGDGQPVLERQVVSLDRTFDDNPEVATLGKQLESDIIQQQMADDAADQVLLRLRAALAAR